MTKTSNSQNDQHLAAVCGWLERMLKTHVESFRAGRDQACDSFAGLHISDSQVDALLSVPGNVSTGGTDLRVEEQELATRFPESQINVLASRFNLSNFDRCVLLIALGPELDAGFQTLYAYVQNDVTRKLPSVCLALTLLCTTQEERWQARSSFASDAPLVRNLLLQLARDTNGRHVPHLASTLCIPRRISEFLLGHISFDDQLEGTATLNTAEPNPQGLYLTSHDEDRLWRCTPHLREGGLVILRGQHGAGKFAAAESVCAQLGRQIIVSDLRSHIAGTASLGRLLRRECTLLNAALYLKLGACPPDQQEPYAELERSLSSAPFPIFLSIEEPEVSALAIAAQKRFSFEFEVPDLCRRRQYWAFELTRGGEKCDLDLLASQYRFTEGQIHEVAEDARCIACVRRGATEIEQGDIVEAVRHLYRSSVSRLAQPVELIFTWNDLILPPRLLQQLREIQASVRHKHLVHSGWGFESKVGRHVGTNVLFSGASGTGKTMAASVLARSLGLDLYRIDLSRIVSKYVGDTEKNLQKIFDGAEQSNAVLFFDEADALFGKRSDVKDAHDRYANVEVAYLLQKMEQFTGLAILATNLSRNLDSAFIRRMHHAVEFPFPDVAHREKIWRQMFPAQAPVANDVDFGFLSRQFELSGGNIRNAVTTGAFLAAEQDRAISMEHLVRAIVREMQKMGKLPSKADFQDHFEIISRLGGDR